MPFKAEKTKTKGVREGFRQALQPLLLTYLMDLFLLVTAQIIYFIF